MTCGATAQRWLRTERLVPASVKKASHNGKGLLRLSVSNNIDVLRERLLTGMGSRQRPRSTGGDNKRFQLDLKPTKNELINSGRLREKSRKYVRDNPYKPQTSYSQFRRKTRLMWQSRMSNMRSPMVPITHLGR